MLYFFLVFYVTLITNLEIPCCLAVDWTLTSRSSACHDRWSHALWASLKHQHPAWTAAPAAVHPQGRGQVAPWLLLEGIHSNLQRLPVSLWILDWTHRLLRPHSIWNDSNIIYQSYLNGNTWSQNLLLDYLHHFSYTDHCFIVSMVINFCFIFYNVGISMSGDC